MREREGERERGRERMNESLERTDTTNGILQEDNLSIPDGISSTHNGIGNIFFRAINKLVFLAAVDLKFCLSKQTNLNKNNNNNNNNKDNNNKNNSTTTKHQYA